MRRRWVGLHYAKMKSLSDPREPESGARCRSRIRDARHRRSLGLGILEGYEVPIRVLGDLQSHVGTHIYFVSGAVDCDPRFDNNFREPCGRHLESAYDTPTMQVAVMAPVLC